MPPMMAPTTPSPCVRLCTLDDNNVCLGCGRTLDDIKGWTKMSEPEKQACVARADQRRRQLGWRGGSRPSL
jgi:predicted Fe-S protein YdhL (DUF1289 family)